MKKRLLGILTAMMAVSLAAGTPPTEKKQGKQTTLQLQEAGQHDAQTTAEQPIKVRIQKVAPVAIISYITG